MFQEKHWKRLMDGNQQPSVQQELERLFLGTKGGGKGGESRELYRVGASELSTTTADTNTSFATPSMTERTIAEIWRSKSCGDSQ